MRAPETVGIFCVANRQINAASPLVNTAGPHDTFVSSPLFPGTYHYCARFAGKGDWLRGANQFGTRGNVMATVPVPFSRRRYPGPVAKKGTGTVAGDRVSMHTLFQATEPVPIFATADLVV